MSEIGSINDLGSLKTPLNKRSYDFVKRSIDVLVSASGLILTSPLLPFIALVIKLDSKGPVFFVQERQGKDGESFHIKKLRTMHQPEDTEAQSKLRNTKVTRTGKVLRKFSIDELPQLWDVLIGNMSLVGPRPIIPEERNSNLDISKKILSVKPGLTSKGTLFIRNKAYKDLNQEERDRIDAEYIDQQTVLSDLALLLRTIFYLHKGR